MWEPEWFKTIPSNAICNYFYIIFMIIAVAAAIVLLGDVAYMFSSGGRKGGMMLLMRSVIAFALPLVNALFLYILCSRSLLGGK